MAEITNADVTRLKALIDRFDADVNKSSTAFNGNDTATYNADGGALVPSYQKWLKDHEVDIADAEADKIAAQAAATAAQGYRDQASEIAGLGTVADAVGVINLPQPDVYIPFNDGLRIESGYGTFDKINVGGTDYDLPTRSVDFSRASSSTGINKSGELVTLGVDEPVITSDGLQVFGSTTNLLTYSEEFDNTSGWSISRSTIVPNSATAPDGTLTADEWDETTVAGASYIYKQNFTTTSATTYTLSVFAKAGTEDVIELKMPVANGFPDAGAVRFNLTSGTIASTIGSPTGGIQAIGDGWYRCSASGTVTTGITSSWIMFEREPEAEVTGKTIYLWGAQLVTGNIATPYIKTGGSAVTRSSDIASIPVRNNLPAPGKPFTVLVDFENKNITTPPIRYIFSSGPVSDPVGALRIAVDSGGTGLLIGNIANGSTAGRAHVTATGVQNSKIRIAASYDGSTLKVFVDGILLGSSTNPINYSLSGSANIGGYVTSGFETNTATANFSIYHTALTDEQIIALGGPQ